MSNIVRDWAVISGNAVMTREGSDKARAEQLYDAMTAKGARFSETKESFAEKMKDPEKRRKFYPYAYRLYMTDSEEDWAASWGDKKQNKEDWRMSAAEADESRYGKAWDAPKVPEPAKKELTRTPIGKVESTEEDVAMAKTANPDELQEGESLYAWAKKEKDRREREGYAGDNDVNGLSYSDVAKGMRARDAYRNENESLAADAERMSAEIMSNPEVRQRLEAIDERDRPKDWWTAMVQTMQNDPMTGFSDAGMTRFIEKESDEAVRAARLYEETAQILRSPYKGDGRLNSIGKGVVEFTTDPDTYTFGLSSIATQSTDARLLKKIANGTDYDDLSKNEQLLLGALMARSEAEMRRRYDTSLWYKGGQIAGDAVPFMAEMAMTGFIGKAATGAAKAGIKLVSKAMNKWLMKHGGKVAAKAARLGEQGIERAARMSTNRRLGKMGAAANRIGDDIANMTVGAAAQTPFMGTSWRTVVQDMRPQLQADGTVEAGMSFWKSVGDAYIEVMSEASGGTIGKVYGATVGKGVGRLLGMLPKGSTIAHVADILGKCVKTSHGALEKMGVHGLTEESMEEVIGNTLRYMTGIQSEEEFREFFAPDNIKAMLIGFAPMSLLGVSMNTINTASVYSGYRRSKDNLRDLLRKCDMADEEITGMMRAIDDSSVDKVGDLVAYMMGLAQSAGQAQQIAMGAADYIMRSSVAKSIKGDLMQETAEAHHIRANNIVTAIEESRRQRGVWDSLIGFDASPETRRDAQQWLDDHDMTAEQWAASLGEMQRRQASGEELEASCLGVTKDWQDMLQEASDKSSVRSTSERLTNKTTGLVTKVRFNDGSEAFVVGGSHSADDVLEVMDKAGKVRQVSSDSIDKVLLETSPDEMYDKMLTSVRFSKEAPRKFPIGSYITMLDDNGADTADTFRVLRYGEDGDSVEIATSEGAKVISLSELMTGNFRPTFKAGQTLLQYPNGEVMTVRGINEDGTLNVETTRTDGTSESLTMSQETVVRALDEQQALMDEGVNAGLTGQEADAEAAAATGAENASVALQTDEQTESQELEQAAEPEQGQEQKQTETEVPADGHSQLEQDVADAEEFAALGDDAYIADRLREAKQRQAKAQTLKPKHTDKEQRLAEMKQIKAERDAADAEVKRWEAAARAVADKAAQGESAAAEEQAQTVDDSKTEELAATDAEERASGSGDQNPQEAEPSERGGGTDEYQTPKEAEAEKPIYTEQELENLYRRFNEQQRQLFAIQEEMRQLLGGTSMEDYKKADAERRAKADELIAQHNEIRQSISHNDLKALSIYLWRRLGKLMKEVDEMEGDTPRALGDELNRLSNDHSSVTRALRDHYDDSNLYHVGVKAEAEQTDKANAKADARYPFDTDRVREQREVFLSVEEARKAEIEYFRRADKNGGLRLATDEKRNVDDEDDPDAVETKMYVPVYTVSYFEDVNSSSDPRVREYDTVDEALANMRYDYEPSDSAPYSQLEVKFKEVWVDKDGDVIEEDDEPRSLYDIARKVKLPDEMQQYEGEDSIILHDETFTTGKEINEEKEEEIRDEIEKVLSKETYVLDGKEVHLNVGSLGKYTDIEVLDADGELMGSFTLRIADHSYNPRNNTTAQLAGNFISVVVNYDDPTAEKFHGRYNIHAGIDDSADSVADEVNERVQEIIDEWDADKEHPRYSLVTPESEMTVQEQEAALRDALVGKLQDAGIEVVTDSEQAQRVINEANGEARLQASLGGLKKASDFILSFLKGGTRQRSSKFEIPERANRLAEKAIGHKINSHTINANELTHAKKRHGVNGSANTENSIPLRDEDFSLMPYIMSAPTRVVKGSMSSNGTESVRYEKDLSNGVVIVVEREGRFDVSDMENITMWAQKKSATNVTVAQRASHSTSETIVISEADAAKIRKDAEDAIRNDEKMRKHKINLYYNPRFSISPVRGEWTKDKIIKRLKDIVGAKTGYSFAARRIAEFDSAEELANHMFYHGTQYGGGRLKPSILMSDREIERIGGGGYGEKYWGVSVSKSKRVASNFSIGRSVRIYPVILVKNAKVKDMPELKDAADLDDCIVDLWKEGVDAVWIGDKNRGEQELCVLNPAAIVNIDTPDVYQNYKLGTPENPLAIIDSDGISKLYEDSKRYVNALEKKPIKPMKPSRFMPTEDGETLGALKSDEQYQQEMSEYESRLDEYNNSDEVRLFNEEEYYASRNIRFFRTPGGDAYGFTVGGRIYVDTRIATAETPIHEYAHLWATALRQTNPAKWNNVVALMKGTGIWDSVRAGYPELTSDDGIADEVLAHYSGRRGAERLREAQREALAGDGVMTAKLAAMEGIRRVREALERFWRGVADFLGIHFTTAEEVADKVLSDLLHGVDPTSAATDAALRMDGKDETGELVAVHNLTEDRLKDALELGGFPMPSIAITKADMGHTTFGDISLLFGRDTIDPGRSENKVYGEDAYTPMFPKIGYKINDDRAEEIQRRAYDAGRMPFFSPAEFAPMNYQDYIDGMNPEGIVEHFMADYGAKQLYLSEKGEAVREEVTKKRKKFPDEQAKRIDAMLDEIGLERLKAFDKRHPDEEVIDAVTAVYGENKDGIMSDSAGRRRMADMIASIVDYAENGNETTEKDPEATRAKIDERIYRDDFERWLRDMFAGIVEKRGLRNNKDLLTPSGKRRRWESLYDEVTLDNVVRHMASQSPKGGEGLFGGSTIGAAQKKYRTMADIRKEARERIRQQSDEEAKQARDEINSRLNALEIPENGNLFDWHIAVRNAVAKSDKASGIYKYLKEDYPTVTMETAKEIEGIVKDIRKMSARFFEAKPYRAVGFDEVKLAVVPSGTSAEVLDALRRRGIAVREYEAGNQEQRKEMVSEATRELNLRFQKEQGTFDGSNAEMADIVARAKADGTYLKAPNGKPSNLSPRQWAQVRTKAFKEWFGNWELAQKVLNIVAAVKEHEFKNFADAKAWANDNIVRTLTNEETGGKGEIRISNNAVSKFLSESAVAKSESKDVHLSVLKVLPDVIRESVDAEQHPDYKKGADGNRSAENGVNDNVTIHRLYGAVDIDGKTYRVKVTLKEYTDSNRPQKAYSYEATKIELLAGTLVGGKTSNPSTNNSISTANLLKGVEKSDGSGEKLLDCSKVVDENGEPLVVYHGTLAKELTKFDPEMVGSRYSYDEKGFFFTSSRSIAHDYSTSEFDSSRRGSIVDAFLSLNSPLIVDSKWCLKNGLGRDVFKNNDAIEFWDNYQSLLLDESEGNDGIIIDDGTTRMVVAFEPTQIKSATDNVGTFSSQNPDIRYQFIGEKGARAMDKAEEATVRLDNLQVARDMEQSGKDAKTVKLATGWERGGDGKWRYEIGDGKVDVFGNLHPERWQLSEEEQEFLKETSDEFDMAFDRGLELTDSERAVDVCVAGGMERSKAERIIYLYEKRERLLSGPKMIDDYLDNDDLFAAYPELREIRVVAGDVRGLLAGVRGSYIHENRTLFLYDMRRDTFLHEVQHAIQRIEGFAIGGSSNTVRQRIEELIYDNMNVYEYTKNKLSLYAEAKIHEFFLAGSYDTLIKSDDPSIREHAIEKYWDAMRFIDYDDRSSLVNEYPDLPSDEIALSGYHVKEAAEELRRLAKSYKDDIPEGNMDVLNLVQKLERFLKEKNNKELYAALGGEVESRNVQKRMGMTEEARRASLASETEDVAREDQIFLYDGLNYAAESRVEENDIEEVNERFNEELQQQIDGTLPKGHVYQLGMPGAVLRAAGFPNAPIELSSTRLAEKAGQRNHQFDISDIKSLPKALSEPMAVFRYGDKSKAENVIVSIERDGKQFVVGVHFNQGRHGIIVSDVRGLFNKNNAEWLNWISQGKAEYLDKEKIQVLIDKQRTNLAEVEYLNLEDVAKVVENFVNPSVGDGKNGNISEDTAVYRIREDAPPAKTGVGYKVFVLKNGKLYPPMVANPRGEATPVGVWLDADAAPVAGMTKTGRQQVKAGGKGTQGGSGKLAYRPGWHLGEIPYAMQFNRLNPETGQRELFPANFVWAEVEYADDVDYQEEAMSYGMNANGKFQHSLAGLPRLPKNGSYKYRTNPDPNTDAWVITGAMKVNRILKPSEVDAMVEAAGREPQRRQNDAVTDEQIDALNREIEGTMKKDASMKRKTAEQMGARLHTPVNIIEDAESVTHPDPEEQARRRNAKGWYDPASGQVNIVIGNNANVDDVAATVFHEVVAHKGLREMIGRERYDEFLDEIYDHLRASTKKAVDADAARRFANEPLRGYRQHRRVAMDELLGRLAEKGFEDFTAEEQGIWERLKEKVIEAINGFLGALKLPKWVRLGDNELRYILWRSHEQMRSRDGEVDAVRDEAKREELGLEPTQEDILFRTKGNKEYNGDKVLWDNNLSIYDNLMAYVMREAESVNGEAKSVRVQKRLRKSARLVSRLSPSLTRSR